MVSPSDFAVLRLLASSYLVTAWMHVGTPPGLLRATADIMPIDNLVGRRSNDCGDRQTSDFAVLRFTTSSNFVGACTGKSAGFHAFRIRST